MARSTIGRRLVEATAHMPLDAKRKPSRQSGVESWFPYYAGYTEEFARSVLQTFDHPSELTVLDPWNGSGTTTRVARSLGCRAFGFDINPVVGLVALAKVVSYRDTREALDTARALSDSAAVDIAEDDALLAWLAPSTVRHYRGIEAKLLSSTSGRANLLSPNLSIQPRAAFLILALIREAREVACVAAGSNPTWLRPGVGRRKSVRSIGKRWLRRVESMASQLSSDRGQLLKTEWTGRIGVADSRNLPIPDESIDVVLTSPPYCTRIDYVVSSSFELAALGVRSTDEGYRDLRRDTMGTPLARRGAPRGIPRDWPAPVRRILSEIRCHPSRDSRSYYYKTYWQYFADARASLR